MPYRNNRTARPKLITADDVGNHVTIAVRKPSGPGTIYVSGTVKFVSAHAVTIARMVYPTGPWDRWEAHSVDTTIAHARITRRA